MNEIERQAMQSKKIMASYSMGGMIYQFIEGVLVFMLFFYYETEIGLESLLTGLALTIYALWDAVNNPLFGYFTDKPYKFTKKWGRRFPWIVIGYVPMVISFLLIFNPPVTSAQGNQWLVFGWLVFTTCLYDTFESIFSANLFALFPDKFRSQEERMTASSINVYIGFVGILLSSILPPMIIVFGDLDSYVLLAWFTAIVGVCGWLLALPGTRDVKEYVEHYVDRFEEMERESFFSALKDVAKQKNFAIYLILMLLYYTLTYTSSTSLYYLVRFVLQTDATIITPLTLVMFFAGLIAILFWVRYVKKTGDNKKSFIFAGLVLIGATTGLTIFSTSLTGIMVVMAIFGVGIGGYWVLINPVKSDVIDESIVISGKRREGLYGGIESFMANIAKTFQVLILSIVHALTGFVEASETQPASAILGIQLHSGIIPAIFMGIGILIFWKLYDLSPEKSLETKAKLKELGI